MGAKETDCMGSICWARTDLPLHLLPPSCSLMTKADPLKRQWERRRKAEDSGLSLGHKGKDGLMPLLYPHVSPEHCGATTSSCWRSSGQFQVSNEGGGNTSYQPGKRQWRSPQTQCWHWNPRPAHRKGHAGSRWIDIQGSGASTDLIFINC